MQILLRILLFFLLFTMLCFGLHACSKKPEMAGPIHRLGVEPVHTSKIVNGYDEVLSAWVQAGYRHMTVVHAGPWDGLAFMTTDSIKDIRMQSEGKAPEKVNARNFLFAASRLGLVKRIFWIIPYAHVDYINAEERIRLFLRKEASYFRQKDIDSMKFSRGCVSGTLSDIDITICSPATMPQLGEPVLMTLDAAFFPSYSISKGFDVLRGLKEFFDAIAVRKLLVQSVYIISSDALPARYGYLPEEVMTVLKDPQLLLKAPPDLWSVRDEAVNMLLEGEIKKSLSLLNRSRKKYPDDPYLNLLREFARVRIGEKASALNNLEQHCTRTEFFCRGMVDIGISLREKGDFEGAIEFFEKVLRLKPSLDIARLEYARTLYSRGTFADAGELLSAVSDPRYLVEASFLRGDCAYALKKENDAITNYEKGLKLYREIGSYRPNRSELESLKRLRELYEKRNDVNGLKLVKEMPVFE